MKNKKLPIICFFTSIFFGIISVILSTLLGCQIIVDSINKQTNNDLVLFYMLITTSLITLISYIIGIILSERRKK